VAMTADGMASTGDRALLEHGKLTSARIAAMRQDLARLPPMPAVVDALRLGERFFFLDCASAMAREGPNVMDLSGVPALKKPAIKSFMDSFEYAAADWDLVLRTGNSWYDRMVDACRQPTLAAQRTAADKLNRDLQDLSARRGGWRPLGWVLRGPGNLLADEIVALLLPAGLAAAEAQYRAAMCFELTKLAFALAQYRADHGSYPPKLADLLPKYVAKLPQDVFSDADFHYRCEGGGFLLYSVGPNGQDNGGKGRNDPGATRDCDDLAVRLPAPK
jgi:hypothetical protein